MLLQTKQTQSYSSEVSSTFMILMWVTEGLSVKAVLRHQMVHKQTILRFVAGAHVTTTGTNDAAVTQQAKLIHNQCGPGCWTKIKYLNFYFHSSYDKF